MTPVCPCQEWRQTLRHGHDTGATLRPYQVPTSRS